jgi:hypothetical protein
MVCIKMAVTEIKLTNVNRDDILYYETGFEQLHPYIFITQWMEDQGFQYQKDWRCISVRHSFQQRSYYKLQFDTEEMASIFALKWL